MLISILKYIKYLKVLRHVSILTDHHPWWWSVKIETCRSTFKYFYVF